jgi:hypothetical protein
VPKNRQIKSRKTRAVIFSIAGLFIILGIAVWITGGWRWEILGNRVILERANHPFAYALYLILAGIIFTKDRLGFRALCERTANKPIGVIIAVLAGLTVFLLAAHFIAPHNHPLWNLDVQTDLGTYYHSILLFAGGMFVLSIYDFEKSAKKKAVWGWIPILAVFWGISIDELISFHNGIPRYLEKTGLYSGIGDSNLPEWPILLAPIAIIVVIYFVAFARSRLSENKNLLILGSLALVIWVFAFSAEMFLATSMNHKLQVGIEEGAELIGSSMFTLLFIKYFRKIKAIKT